MRLTAAGRLILLAAPALAACGGSGPADGGPATTDTGSESDSGSEAPAHRERCDGFHAVHGGGPGEVWAGGWNDLLLRGDGDAFAVGEERLALRFDGEAWAPLPEVPGDTDLRDVWGDADRVWAVGYERLDSTIPASECDPEQRAVVLEFDGNGWTAVLSLLPC